MRRRISFAQNGEDVRIWHAFGPRGEGDLGELTYVDVGANQPRHMSLTAALYDLGWRGLLVEADPDLVTTLREERPGDHVIHAAASAADDTLTFYRVPGTGLGTLDPREAQRAEARGFAVHESQVPSRRLDVLLTEFRDASGRGEIHVLSIDVEGAEADVLAGLSFTRHRPWVLCVEAVEPGSTRPSHHSWEAGLVERGYRFVAFDGINRWYVAEECADIPVSEQAGAEPGTTISEAIATPLHVLDEGLHGWIREDTLHLRDRDNRGYNRIGWQRRLILDHVNQQVPVREYARQIGELRSALLAVEGSRTFALSRRLARVGRRIRHILTRARQHLPTWITNRLIRARHLRHVTAGMTQITDPAYLGAPVADDLAWLGRDDGRGPASRPPLPPVTSVDPLGAEDVHSIEEWLAAYPFDSDADLDARMDNHGDEVGRARAALRTRLRLRETPDPARQCTGSDVLVDARSLQTPAFGHRGIGRFATAALRAARMSAGESLTLLVDRGLPALSGDIAGDARQVTRVDADDAGRYAAFIQPSPMTHSPDPLIPLLHSDAQKIALVFDFIPLHYPTVYLRHPAARLEYAADLDALALYDRYICISKVTEVELVRFLRDTYARTEVPSVVAWPRAIDEYRAGTHLKGDARGPIVLMTGDEPRKNTFGGLAGIAAATSDEGKRDVIVLGMAGQEVRVHHWSIGAAMRPGEARTLGRVTDDELTDIVRSASCVVVPSFDEGLSLPVIEAVQAGVPVVTSAIPSHRELVGSGSFECDPRSPRSIARAVRRTRGTSRVHRTQERRLAGHQHACLEDFIADFLAGVPRDSQEIAVGRRSVSGRRVSVGVATPWVPQRTGVADFSTAVFTELARHVDLTVYTTSDAIVQSAEYPDGSLTRRSVDEVLADPREVQARHDVFLSVMGNSHFHLPFVELLQHVDAGVVAHDTRMVEFYMALRGRGGVEQLMLLSADPEAPGSISPPLDDQIDDMRLLQNAGFWEIAGRSTSMFLHSLSAAPRIERETHAAVRVLPFANQRVPHTERITVEDRRVARQRLGLDASPLGTWHIASFGYVDPRTKMTDVVIEAAGWLAQWGHPVALHLVGAASDDQRREVSDRASRAGLGEFEITGFQTEEQFRDWLLAVDIGVQLRVSPLLGVSGPLSDLAAFGTPAVASAGLCIDVDTPGFIHRLPDAVSSLMVAEAIETTLTSGMNHDQREDMRRDYLSRKSPEVYVRLLLDAIGVSR